MTKIVASGRDKRSKGWVQVEHKRTGKRDWVRREGKRLVLRSESEARDRSQPRDTSQENTATVGPNESEPEPSDGRKGVRFHSGSTLDYSSGDATVSRPHSTP